MFLANQVREYLNHIINTIFFHILYNVIIIILVYNIVTLRHTAC